EDGIRDYKVTGVQTCALPIYVDKVDFAVSPYASTQIAPAMPIMIQKKRLYLSLFGTGINDEFNYDRYFSMLPTGPDPKPAFTTRSEERRVGKERKLRRTAVHR